MYRLLIVDDEPAIVDGLVQQVLDSDEFELDLCKAYNAQEALAIVRTTKIDIVISDVRMPGKSGLQLADDISFYWPACRIVLLSGYSEFDYVYSAIQKNVDRYILKTEGVETILDAVRSSIAILDEEQRNRVMLEQAKRQMSVAEPLMKKLFFEALLHGDHLSEIGQIGYFSELTLCLDRSSPLLIIVGKPEIDRACELTFTRKLEKLESVLGVFDRHLPAIFENEHVVFEQAVIVWFIQPKRGHEEKFIDSDGQVDWRSIASYLKSGLEPVQNMCRNTLGISISFALGPDKTEWDKISKVFEKLKTALKHHSAFGQPMAIIDLDMKGGLTHNRSVQPVMPATEFNKMLNEWSRMLERGNTAEAALTAEGMIRNIRHDMTVHYSLGIERYYTFLAAVISQLDEAAPGSPLPLLELPVEWNLVEQQFSKLIEMAGSRRQSLIEKREHLQIERIHQFIQNNLGNDLSLARIAESVFFNPSYLSRFYKQVTGRNISDYIYTAKTDAAMAMLADPALKINEVALRLGFESPSYFTAFFRKMTGSSPQEYRETLQLRSRP
ncbi:response regulator [Paenibacillus chungangensis]|uniref:Response regulator n=1 Tax=Paenibacillus chungangensis TaxID=696535 RepID=A0ABW3HPK5_9BACL